MTGAAVFSALALVVSFFFRLPVLFLTFDAKDAVITIASFIYGPVVAPIMSLVVALVEMVTYSETGMYGFIMNFASSTAFSLTAALIYKFKRTFAGSIIGLYSAILFTVSVMMLLNTFVTPYYMGVARSEVVAMLPTVLLPFNFAKALLNSAIVMLLYKPVIYSLRRAGLVKGKAKSNGINENSAVAIITAMLSIAASVVIFIILKQG